MSKLSAVIITFNEEKNIGRCIDSLLPVADEIVVLDSFSTDKTISIAKQKGAVVYQQQFAGYLQQKNKAFHLATHGYILSLDADEALNEELIASILQVKKTFSNAAYEMNRCNVYCGHEIKHGLWYPDKKIRLFDKSKAYCGGFNPHDKIILTQNVPALHLKGDLMHYTYTSLQEYKQRNDEVSTTAAQSLFEMGKRTSLLKLIASPAWTFINGYIFKRGFLDGTIGWTIAINTTKQSFQKYYKLYRLQKGNKESTTELQTTFLSR